MPRYKCLIRGENFLFEKEDGPTLMGFYTTRFVRAADEKEAEIKCLGMLKDKEDYGVKPSVDNNYEPRVFFIEIRRARRQFSFKFGKGNVFFPMSAADENGDHSDALEIELEAHKRR